MSDPSRKRERYFSTHNEISRPVQRHLVHLYLVLAAMLALAAYGSVAQTPRMLMTSGGTVETGVVLGSALGIRHLDRSSIWRWVLLGVWATWKNQRI